MNKVKEFRRSLSTGNSNRSSKEMSDFWKRKMRKYFSTIDFDNDGAIAKSDFIGMAQNFAKFQKPGCNKATDLKTALEKVWEYYTRSVDIGDKNTLTADVLIASIGMQRNDPELINVINAIAQIFHDMLDLNRDGYLDEVEYGQMLLGLGVPDQSFVKQAFKAIDVNGDGRLSLEEFMSGYFHFFYSDDEASPNALFFGPLDV